MGSAEIGNGPIGDVLRGGLATMRAGPGLAASVAAALPLMPTGPD